MKTETGNSARLRPLEESDLELVLDWRNHPRIRQSMYTQHEISLDEHRSWFMSANKDPDRTLLVFEAGGQPCGFVNFRRTAGSGDAIWGFYLAPDAPKGVGQLLGQVATEYGFEVLGVARIRGEALRENLASQRFHLRHGFSTEKVLPSDMAGDTTIKSTERYVLTRDAWLAHREKIK